MKKVSIIAAVLLGAISTNAQTSNEINSKNSWLKLGIIAGAPVSDASDYSTVSVGVDLRGQYMIDPNFGIGVVSGYNHFFGKNDANDLNVIPVGAMLRYYPKYSGIYLGTDLGYSFVTNDGVNGGFYLRPQLGYNNSDWNFYGYYDRIFTNDNDVQSVGLGVSYNLKFK